MALDEWIIQRQAMRHEAYFAYDNTKEITMSAFEYYKFFLKVDDLQGKEHTVKVARVYVHQVYNPNTRKQEPKLAMSFENRKKDMILNATQADAMMSITGTEHEQKWIGAEITLAACVGFNNKKTIRIMGAPKPSQLFAGKNVLVAAE